MYCGQCGHPVSRQAKYCGSCGASRRPLRATLFPTSAPAFGTPGCCAACGQSLTTTAVTVQGAMYHPHCRPDRLQHPPHCAACARTLHGSYVVFDGASFHDRCFASYRATLASCTWCGSWTPPPGHIEQEGLTVCRACHATAINTPAQATPLMRDVVAWLHQQGVWWPPQPLPLRLVERHRLQSAQHPQRFGLTTTRVAWQPGRGEQRVVEQVLVRQGLPSVPFTACLAHELGHVWLHLRGLDGLASWEEEGLCEYLAYRYVLSQETLQSRRYAAHLVQNPDPVYGEGLRRVRAVVEQVGWSGVVQAVEGTGRLPWPS